MRPATCLTLPLLLLLSLKTTDTAASVSVSKSCYATHENFVVSFTDGSPIIGDKVGFVSSTGGSILLSVSTCGTSSCSRSGTISVRESLTAGRQYKAQLMRANNNILATSSIFRVATSCAPTNPPTRSPTKKPTRRPTKRPVAPPTNAPTPSPSPSPLQSVPTTSGPTTHPTTAIITSSGHIHGDTKAALLQARGVIAGLISANARLIPEFLRMGFHDCVGGCDVVAQFVSASTGVSRADIWALAVMTATDVAPRGPETTPVRFDMKWFGRIDCENANLVCFDAHGVQQPCGPTSGPRRDLPMQILNHQEMFKFFADNFGFNQRQTVAVMGAHAVGHLVTAESGVDGPNGWDFINDVLQNEYYMALLGGGSAANTDAEKVQFAPGWRSVFQDNSALAGVPSRHLWNLVIAGKKMAMLNADISLVRDLNPSNANAATGEVSCTFQSSVTGSLCPLASTFNFASEFLDNNVWMNEFNYVLDLMLTNGYNRQGCGEGVCPLTSKIPPQTKQPTPSPSKQATLSPTTRPFASPSQPPTEPPTKSPTTAPIVTPPSPVSTTSSPTDRPTLMPTNAPTAPPSAIGVAQGTASPSVKGPADPPVMASTSLPTAK